MFHMKQFIKQADHFFVRSVKKKEPFIFCDRK